MPTGAAGASLPDLFTILGMRIDEILKRPEPSFSVEFFPPKTEEGRTGLFETVEVLSKLDPSFFSVTYGAGGSTHDRQTTLEITRSIRDDHGVEAMAHLNCVGESAEGLRGVVDEHRRGRDRERPRPAGRSSQGPDRLRAARRRAGQRGRAGGDDQRGPPAARDRGRLLP